MTDSFQNHTPPACIQHPEDIDAQKLSVELGLQEHRLSDDYYTEARGMLSDFCEKIIPQTHIIETEQIGDFLMENIDDIMTIFDQYPLMWRWPLCILQEHVDEIIVSPTLASLSDDTLRNNHADALEYMTRTVDNAIVILCFAIVVSRGRKHAEIQKKYGDFIHGQDSIRNYIADELDFQIKTTWGRRYMSLMQKILGDNFQKIVNAGSFRGNMSVDDPTLALFEEAKQWKPERRYERVFINNESSKKHPELDIEGVNFFLCQNHIYGYSPTIQSLATHENYLPVWKVWIKKYKQGLLNPESEIHKVFCYAFNIVGGLFRDNELSEEAKNRLPSELYTLLFRWTTPSKKIKTTSTRIIEVLAATTTPPQKIDTAHSLSGIIFNQGENTLHFSKGLPAETKRVEIRIYKNRKVVGFGIYDGANKDALCLSEDTFINQNITAHAPLILGKPLTYVAGEKYQIGITACLQVGKSQEFLTEHFIIPKERKILPVVHEVREKVTVTMATFQTILPKIPTILAPPAPPVPEISKDRKESEKEDLQTALEFFLEKSDQELLSFFQEHSRWFTDTQTLTLNVPIGELAEMGYVPNKAVLTEEEYTPLLQWKIGKENGQWILPEGMPDTVKKIVEDIYHHHLGVQAIEKEKSHVQKIDTELSQLGLRPSRRSTDALQRVFRDICKKKSVDFARLDAKMTSLGIREQGYRFFHNGSNSITLAKKQGESKNNEWSINYNWGTDTFHIVGLEKDNIFRERLKNALVRFLARIDEETIDEMLLLNIRTFNNNKEGKNDLEAGLKERLQRGQASLFVRFQGQDILIPDVSSNNYQEKITEIRAKYTGETPIYVVYRTYSYALYDEEFRKGQEETYNQCIENHLDMMQARCRATLAQKAHCKENTSNGENTSQERGPFTHGVADHCRKFFFKKDPFSTEDMEEFMEYIQAESTPEEKRDILYIGVRDALFGDTKNTNIDPSVCREFFFKKDPNNLDDIAEFLAFLQERGTNEQRRPGEKHVGIVYYSPVIGPVSDIPRILAKETKKKPKKSTLSSK